MVSETLMFQNILSHSDTNLFILKNNWKRENQLIKIQQHELKRSPWKPKFDTRKSNKYINELWGFVLDLGHYWYELKEFNLWDDLLSYLLVADQCVSTEKQPFFRQDRFPMQTNIVIGKEPGPSSWEKTSAFATKLYLSKGYKILGEHHITVYDTDHYAISYILGGRIPTRKYSIVIEHPRLKQYIEFAFTISIYGSIEDFEQNIDEADALVRSFTWL